MAAAWHSSAAIGQGNVDASLPGYFDLRGRFECFAGLGPG